jgi:hypothetical protein
LRAARQVRSLKWISGLLSRAGTMRRFDPSDVVEVAARELLSLALERRDEAYAAQLVDVCVAYALCEVDRYTRFGDCSVVVLCVPFKLLEDALDASSVAGCEFWWAQVERSCDALTHASLFQRGKFVLLRLCNSLLRRLSRTRHAELCGRVRLADAFFLSLFQSCRCSCFLQLPGLSLRKVQ